LNFAADKVERSTALKVDLKGTTQGVHARIPLLFSRPAASFLKGTPYHART
jgi:hypothetical protein